MKSLNLKLGKKKMAIIVAIALSGILATDLVSGNISLSTAFKIGRNVYPTTENTGFAYDRIYTDNFPWTDKKAILSAEQPEGVEMGTFSQSIYSNDNKILVDFKAYYPIFSNNTILEQLNIFFGSKINEGLEIYKNLVKMDSSDLSDRYPITDREYYIITYFKNNIVSFIKCISTKSVYFKRQNLDVIDCGTYQINKDGSLKEIELSDIIKGSNRVITNRFIATTLNYIDTHPDFFSSRLSRVRKAAKTQMFGVHFYLTNEELRFIYEDGILNATSEGPFGMGISYNHKELFRFDMR